MRTGRMPTISHNKTRLVCSATYPSLTRVEHTSTSVRDTSHLVTGLETCLRQERCKKISVISARDSLEPIDWNSLTTYTI